jgi:hypothetical protein
MKGAWVMKVEEFRNVSLIMVFLIVLAIAPLGCGKTSDAGSNAGLRAARIEASLDRLTKVLQLNPDGTVSLDVSDPDYVSLVRGDTAFGKALLASLNAKAREGLIRVNTDFSVEWLGPPSSCSKCAGGASCKTHWWGESCNVSSSTTKDILIGLESGEGALIICGFIPVVDVACEIIEVVGAIPLEAEIRPCADKGDSSTFHVTWIGAAWFTCN